MCYLTSSFPIGSLYHLLSTHNRHLTSYMVIGKETCDRSKPRSYSTKFCTGSVRPEVETLTILYVAFARRGNLSNTFGKKDSLSQAYSRNTAFHFLDIYLSKL